MPKYRSREIVTAEQWIPGKKISGVQENADGSCAFVAVGPDDSSWYIRIEPGAYVIHKRAKKGTDIFPTQEAFEAAYEDIGGE